MTKAHFSNKKRITLPFQNYLREISIILLLLFLNFVIGCSYYKVSTLKDNTPLAMHIKSKLNYFIVHDGTDAWHLSSPALNDEQKALTGKLDSLPRERQNYLYTNTSGNTKYKPARKGNPTQEIHVYVAELLKHDTFDVVIPLSAIEKIEIYDQAAGATTLSYVFGTIGVILGVMVVIGIIALALKSSCPFVYVKDGNKFKYTGEMFGGAIYSSLERDDFMPLPVLQYPSQEYQIKITNELLERQFINLINLAVIEHPVNSKVLLDKHGHIQTIVKPESPVKAYSDRKDDYVGIVSKSDSSYYIFNDENVDNPDVSNLTLAFKKPANSQNGKLVLNLKNSFWLDYIYGKFNEQFGTRFNEFSEKQKSVSQERINQWSLNQNIPLSVYIKNDTAWEYVDYFQVVGPLASRDVVMAIDLRKVKGEEVVIRLECGYMFWDVDYVAMDFTQNIPATRTDATALSAINEEGKNVTSSISQTDDKYLVQLNIGNETLLTYKVPPASGDHLQTIFLHSRGYYEYIRDYKNKPDILKLMTFKSKGSFTKFSKDHYSDFVGESLLFESLLTSNNEK